MSVFSDVDIRKALGKDIVIEPFSESSLTPIGYDFTVGEFIYSLEHGMLEPQDGIIEIPPHSTIQILTKESLWVSGRVGGTFHSKVSLVSRGFSHVSTTLDPGWYGPLLITIRNNMDKHQKLKKLDAFVTLIFFSMTTPTTMKHFKPEFRKDILISQLTDQTDQYITKIQKVLGDPKILESFEHQVQQANKPMISKVVMSARSVVIRNYGFSFVYILLVGSIIGLVTLQLYWDRVKFLFGNVNYDSNLISSQIAAVISLIAILISTKRK